MEEAVAAAKLGAMWIATVTLVISVMMSYTGSIEARSAARSAARAAAASLATVDWNCTETGAGWPAATAAGAAASGDRLGGSQRLRVVDFALHADTATCTVLASIEVLPTTVGWWMGTTHAVGCSPTRAGVGLGVLTACGQGP